MDEKKWILLRESPSFRQILLIIILFVYVNILNYGYQVFL